MKNIYCDGRGIRWNADNPNETPRTVLIIEFTGNEQGRDSLRCMGIKTVGPSFTVYDPTNPKDGGRITIWREVSTPIEILHVDGTWELIT